MRSKASQNMAVAFKNTLSWLLVIWLAAGPALALPGGEEQMGYTTYYFSDSGGNSVTTSSFNLAKKLWKRTLLLLDLEVDNVYVPPVSAVTGATRPKRQSNKPFEKTRGQAIVGIEQGLGGNTTMALNVYRSQEVDYQSNSAIVTFSQEMFRKNTVVTLRGQVIQDRVGKILDDGSLRKQDKESYWVVGNISQILSQATVFDLSYDYYQQEGYLSDPYRQVRVFDSQNAFVFADERHPGQRLRQAVTGRISQSIPELRASLIGRYRYYFDDWEVKSHTAEVQLNKYIFGDLIAKFNYRYYTQDAAEFYRPTYRGDEFLNGAYRTADYKLRNFDSNNFGVTVTVLFRKMAQRNPNLAFLANSSVDLRYFRYFNTLDFSANIFQMNINFGI